MTKTISITSLPSQYLKNALLIIWRNIKSTRETFIQRINSLKLNANILQRIILMSMTNVSNMLEFIAYKGKI